MLNIRHTGIYVEDIAKQAEFYKKCFFMTIICENYQDFILQFAEWKTAEDRMVYAVDTNPITISLMEQKWSKILEATL